MVVVDSDWFCFGTMWLAFEFSLLFMHVDNAVATGEWIEMGNGK